MASTNAVLLTNGIASGNPITSVPHQRPMDFKIVLNRILKVSPFSDDEETSGDSLERVKSVARAVSSLQPSLVLGLLRITEEAPLRPYQVAAFRLLRNEVIVANPRCKFDVEINVSKYPTASELLAKLEEVNAKLAPDIIIMMTSKNNEVVYPSVLAKGIEYAHAHGQVIGYGGTLSMIPNGVDFLVMRATSLEVHRDEITALRAKHHLPILVEVPAAFVGHDHHEGSSSATQLDTREQAKLLTRLAEEQNSFGYHFIYPMIYPQVNKQHPLSGSIGVMDNSLLVTLRALMVRFN